MPDSTKKTPRKNKKGRFTRARIAAMIAMDQAGHSARNIARQLECAPNTVIAHLRHVNEYLEDPQVEELVKKWVQLEPTELALIRSKALRRLNEKLDKNEVGARDLTLIYGVSFDKARLAEGKSTHNLFHGVLAKIKEEALEINIAAITKAASKQEDHKQNEDESDRRQNTDGVVAKKSRRKIWGKKQKDLTKRRSPPWSS